MADSLISQPLLVAYFESDKEASFKEFVLNPHRRLPKLIETDDESELNLHNGSLYIVKSGGLQRLGRFATSESFLLIFLRIDPTYGIQSVLSPSAQIDLKMLEQCVLESDLQLTFTFKRSITSVASLLKSYNLPEAANQLKKGRQSKSASSHHLQQVCDDLVDIMGCEGMRSN